MPVQLTNEQAVAWGKSCDDFTKSGLLWWVNRILHTFGWSIVVMSGSADDGTEFSVMYPARTDHFGFDDDVDAACLRQFRASCRSLPASVETSDADV